MSSGVWEMRLGRPAVPTSSAPRPLNITAAGLYMLFGACLMPINIWTHAPAFLLGADFRGWPAVLFFLAIGTLDAGIGIGLLRFAPWSRMAAIYFFLFRILNTAVTFLLPGSRARFEDGVAAVEASLGRAGAPHPPLWFGAALELGVMGLVLVASSHEQSGLRSDRRADGRARSGFVMCNRDLAIDDAHTGAARAARSAFLRLFRSPDTKRLSRQWS